jgi:hypothetical protein
LLADFSSPLKLKFWEKGQIWAKSTVFAALWGAIGGANANNLKLANNFLGQLILPKEIKPLFSCLNSEFIAIT